MEIRMLYKDFEILLVNDGIVLVTIDTDIYIDVVIAAIDITGH